MVEMRCLALLNASSCACAHIKGVSDLVSWVRGRIMVLRLGSRVTGS